MAQADSVPSSSRQLVTGESTNQSTNLRAVNLTAVRVKPVDRRYFIGSSDAEIIVGTDNAPVWLGREKRGDAEPEDLLSGRWYGPCTGPMGSNIGTLFCATAVFFLGWLRRNILPSLLLFLNRNERLRLSAFDKVSSNQLVRSKPQERLR